MDRDDSSAKVWPRALLMDRFSIRSVIHLHGPPLTENPRQCQVHELGYTGSPTTGRQYSRVLRKTRARRDDGNNSAASGEVEYEEGHNRHRLATDDVLV